MTKLSRVEFACLGVYGNERKHSIGVELIEKERGNLDVSCYFLGKNKYTCNNHCRHDEETNTPINYSPKKCFFIGLTSKSKR